MSCEQGGEKGQLCASLQINVIILLSLLYLGCAAGSQWWGGWKLRPSVQCRGSIRGCLGSVFHQRKALFICFFASHTVVRQNEFFMEKNSTMFYCLKNWL